MTGALTMSELHKNIVRYAAQGYAYLFVFVTGLHVGSGIGPLPEWMLWPLVPGVIALILTAIPWPGLGSGGLSM